MSDQPVGRITQLTHTPGPWEVGSATDTVHDYPERFTSVSVSVKAPNSCYVASVSGGHLKRTPREHRITNEEALANARLIAAAPDLLAALHRMLDCHQAAMDAAQSGAAEFVEKRCECGACDDARAAVAKAEGR